tara:strand:+ start:7524 stop:8333 length:810 start_codon:yes stop_codon:yes gene_type:complete
MFLATCATAFTSAGTGYYIYKYHPDHFRDIVLNKTIETYANVKITTGGIVNKIYSSITGYDPENNKVPPLTIKDVKLIQPELIVDLPVSGYNDLNWANYQHGSMIHVIYEYQGQEYRCVFSYQQDLSILTTNTEWLENGFHNGIDCINSNLPDQTSLWELIHQYSGPLGDFYNEVKHIQNSKGFLNHCMTERLITDPKIQSIQVTTILGDCRRFPAKVHPSDVEVELDVIENNEVNQDNQDNQDNKDNQINNGEKIEGEVIKDITPGSF